MGGSLLDEELIALGAVAKQFPAARGERGSGVVIDGERGGARGGVSGAMSRLRSAPRAGAVKVDTEIDIAGARRGAREPTRSFVARCGGP